jgi:hypothetical protein
MLLKCRDCNNADQDKFTSTPQKIICLVCYEKNIEMTPQNEAERARVAIANYIKTTTQDGRVRRFAQGYRAMASQLTTLQSIPNMTDFQKCYLDGYLEAVKVFHENS